MNLRKSLFITLLLSFSTVFFLFLAAIINKSISFRPNDVVVGEKWNLYLLQVEGLFSQQPRIVSHKIIDVIPRDKLVGSELRSYDPTYFKHKSIPGKYYIAYEPCYFKGKDSAIKYDCNLQYFYLDTNFLEIEKTFTSEIMFDPTYKVSFPIEFNIDSKYYYSFESGLGKEVKLLEANNANVVLSYKHEIYDPIIFEYNSDLHLLANTPDKMLACTTSRSFFLRDKKFANNDCTEYEFGEDRYERNAGPIYIDNGTIYRFTMNNSNGQFGTSVDLFEITALKKSGYKQKLLKNNFLQDEIMNIDKNIIKYHHISIVERIGTSNHLILIDAAWPTYTRMHGKTIQNLESFN